MHPDALSALPRKPDPPRPVRSGRRRSGRRWATSPVARPRNAALTPPFGIASAPGRRGCAASPSGFAGEAGLRVASAMCDMAHARMSHGTARPGSRHGAGNEDRSARGLLATACLVPTALPSHAEENWTVIHDIALASRWPPEGRIDEERITADLVRPEMPVHVPAVSDRGRPHADAPNYLDASVPTVSEIASPCFSP